MKSVGIDIGSASIKVAEVNLTNKGLVVSQYNEFALGQNPGFDPNIEIIEFLRSVSIQYNPEQTRIVVGLRQEMVAVRNKIFPFSDRIKILKSLPFELEEDIPFSPENAIYDAKIVKVLGHSAEVLACAAPKLRITELMAKMQDANIDISLLSCEGLALANCWEKWNEAPSSISNAPLQLEGEDRPERHMRILLDIGHTRTLVCAFEDNHLIGLRSILWGGKNLAETLMRKYELPYVEALNVLETKSFVLLNQENSSYDQIVFSQTITEGLNELARDVQMTLLEFQSEFNGKVMGVSLTGGISLIQNLNAYMTQILEVPVNPVQILNGNFTVGFEVTPHIDSTCGVALGLAIEGLKKPRNPALNFLKNEFQKQNLRYQKLWENWGRFAKLAAVAFVAFTAYSVIRDQVALSLVEKSTEALKNQAKAVAKLPSKQSNETGVKKFIKEQRLRTQDIKAIQNLAKMNSALDVLRKISDVAPGKTNSSVLVRRLNIQNQHVEIEGSVGRAQELTVLQASLTSLSITGKLEILKSTVQSPGRVPFAFSLNVDRGISGTTEKVKK